MKWRCGDCDRVYDDPPETCVCGSANLLPDEGSDRSRYSLLALRERLLDPKNADRSLVRDEPYVSLAFRILFAVAVFCVLLLVVGFVL
ncbi:hypothetical protein HWV23_16575 [Natronomonas halophila]|uniref:hypothetical protein n=1 Tax=Natronomonas halophila TaxID=2747817 RepID=UPI0015B3DD51|nr:hypothetical protein [Natronomonas halophila]QLD87267.1 hypothetical protein HWV23_16575 [Natronomonas halophila]